MAVDIGLSLSALELQCHCALSGNKTIAVTGISPYYSKMLNMETLIAMPYRVPIQLIKIGEKLEIQDVYLMNQEENKLLKLAIRAITVFPPVYLNQGGPPGLTLGKLDKHQRNG